MNYGVSYTAPLIPTSNYHPSNISSTNPHYYVEQPMHFNSTLNTNNLSPHLYPNPYLLTNNSQYPNQYFPSYPIQSPLTPAPSMPVTPPSSNSKKEKDRGSSSFQNTTDESIINKVSNSSRTNQNQKDPSSFSDTKNKTDSFSETDTSEERETNKESSEINDQIKQITGNSKKELYSFIQSKSGSKDFQKILGRIKQEGMNIPEDFNKRLFSMDISTLMLSKYGSFFFEKYVQLLNKQQRVSLLTNKMFQSNFVELCSGRFSNMVVQALIKTMTNIKIEEEIFMKLISDSILDLASNQCSNFVLNKVLQTFSFENKTFLLQYIEENVLEFTISTKYGHYLAKNYITYLSGKEADYDKEGGKKYSQSNSMSFYEDMILIRKKKFLKIVLGNLHTFASHKQGHFVIIDCIEIWGVNFCKDLISCILNDIEILSKGIYGYAIAKRIFILYKYNTDFIQYFSMTLLNSLSDFQSAIRYNLTNKLLKACFLCSEGEDLERFFSELSLREEHLTKQLRKELQKLQTKVKRNACGLGKAVDELFFDR